MSMNICLRTLFLENIAYFRKEIKNKMYCLLQDTSIDVQGLYDNHQYLFRVSAINDIGQSKPLTAENPIIAKMPYGKLTTVCGLLKFHRCWSENSRFLTSVFCTW